MSSKYLDIEDDNFYESINKNYAKYKIAKKQKKTLKQICFPKKYEFQIPQKFLAEFINPKTPYRGILVYHRIGAGKTCTAINIAEKFKKVRKIIVVLPAALKGNFRSELRSPCAGNNYITDQERKLLKQYHPSSQEYKAIISKSDARIDKYYIIYSYNKFIELIKFDRLKLINTLLIIDEIHNMISETGIYYELLYHAIKSAPEDMRLVIMSATPIFDKPVEIALTMNLLLPEDKQLPIGQEFINTFIDIKETSKGPRYKVKNMDLFKDYIRGYVSYYRGAPPIVFPRSEIIIVKTKMSDIQRRIYKKIISKEQKTDKIKDYVNIDISNSFFIGTRIASNIVFPNRQFGLSGFNSLKDDDLSMGKIKEYSPKFFKILRKIKRCKGTVFVYSNFKEFGGIRSFARLLEHHRYKNYEFNGVGKKRFAVLTGEQDAILKDEIKTIFNDKNNQYGQQIKVILGSPSVKEGFSFLRIQEVHIIEPYWNWSRMEQIIGRAIRFCSHKDVPYDEQFVKVYIYLAVDPSIVLSIDQRIMRIAIQKALVNGKFSRAIKEVAVDCELFKNANVYSDEESIDCDK